MANQLAIALHPIGAETGSGTGSSVEIGATRSGLALRGEVSGLAAGAVLGMELQTSDDGVTWRFAHRVPEIVQAGYFGPFYALGLARYVRITWTLTGGANVTFRASGDAHSVYAGREDTKIPRHAIEQIGQDVVAEKYISASGVVEGYIGAAYALPILSWGGDLRRATAAIADYDIIRRDGLDPDSPDIVFRDDMRDAIKWLERVAMGQLQPGGIVDSEEETAGGDQLAYSVSAPKRGWIPR